MSTNYYFRNKEEYKRHFELNEVIKNKTDEIVKLISDIVKDEDDLCSIRSKIEDAAHVGYEEIHIGKRSTGWKPLFENCEEFGSVQQMKKWYKNNKDKYEIVNEYGEVLSWGELEDELINWNGERDDRGNEVHKTYKDADGYTWALYEFS